MLCVEQDKCFICCHHPKEIIRQYGSLLEWNLKNGTSSDYAPLLTLTRCSPTQCAYRRCVISGEEPNIQHRPFKIVVAGDVGHEKKEICLYLYAYIYIITDYYHTQSNMNYSSVNILDLSDEMLLTIFNKLNNIDVLYSLIGVNQKLDRLARDIICTQSLDLATLISRKGDVRRILSILNRLCFSIIPQIQHNIQCLTLDS